MASISTTFINVKDSPYFAKGDGCTNDTDAIRQAADDLTALGGGVLYFPRGVYRLIAKIPPNPPPTFGTSTYRSPTSAPVFWPELNAAVWIGGSNVTLLGEGPGSIIQQDGNPRGLAEVPWTIPFCFSFGTKLSGTYDDTSSNFTAAAIALHNYPEFNTGNILIKDLTFRGNISPKMMPLSYGSITNSARGTGAFLAFIGTPTSFARGIRIVNCIFEDANKSTAVCPQWVDDIQFENCTFAALKDFIIGNSVRAAATKNVDFGDDNEMMNLAGRDNWDLWADDYFDGVGVSTGDHALLLNQTDASANGIYMVRDDFQWERAPEMNPSNNIDVGGEIDVETHIRVEQGRSNGLRIFRIRLCPSPIYVSGAQATPKYFYEFVNVLNATTAPVSLFGFALNNVDGGVTRRGDPVLVKDQSNVNENGIYEFNPTGPWKKIQSANLLVRVREGNSNTYNNGAVVDGGPRYFKCDSTPIFTQVAASQIQTLGNPIGFTRVQAASQQNVPLTAGPTANTFLLTNLVDGVFLNTGDFLLLTGQLTVAENGLYIANGGGTIERAFQSPTDAPTQAVEFYLSGAHYTVVAGPTLAGQHFANRTPMRINVGTGTEIFNRAHVFMWAVTTQTTARLDVLAGLQVVDNYQLKTGDLILVRNQHIGQSDQVAAARSNGVYVAQGGAWTRAFFDPGPDEANKELNVFVWKGTTSTSLPYLSLWCRQNRLDTSTTDPSGWVIRNTYYTAEYSRPQIHSWTPVGVLRMIGNTMDGDVIGSGTRWGADGLSWIMSNGGTTLLNGVTIATENVIKNYRFEAIQSATVVTQVINNSFYSGKLFNACALSLQPSTLRAGDNTVMSATLCNNDVSGVGVTLFRNSEVNNASPNADVDLEIIGNTIRHTGNPNALAGSILILRGRRVTIANNTFDRDLGGTMFIQSCMTPLTIVPTPGLSTVKLADLGTLKSGDKIVFWVDPTNPAYQLPPGIVRHTSYFAKIETGTTISVYSDAALTKRVVIGDAFPPGSLIYHRLDSVLSINGNTITNFIVGDKALTNNITIQVAGSPQMFGQILITNNTISGIEHIAINPPVAGTNFVTIGDNIYTDASNTPLDPSQSQFPTMVVGWGSSIAKTDIGQTIVQWGMSTFVPAYWNPSPADAQRKANTIEIFVTN